MKVKELIDMLSMCDSDADVNFQVGFTDIYRKVCAKFILGDKKNAKDDEYGCLKYLSVAKIEQTLFAEYMDDANNIDITLVQDYYTDNFFDKQIENEVCGEP